TAGVGAGVAVGVVVTADVVVVVGAAASAYAKSTEANIEKTIADTTSTDNFFFITIGLILPPSFIGKIGKTRKNASFLSTHLEMQALTEKRPPPSRLFAKS
ncbi:hypothetical protein AB4Z22_30545, partial [Paenibacillus sp. TAF58]